MKKIPISAVPNQSFSVQIDQDFYQITIETTNGCLCLDITRNNVVLITGVRAVAGALVLPYRYMENGNFVFTTLNQEAPDYTKFNVSQSLIFITATELAAARGNGLQFNPIGTLPARFAPPAFSDFLLTEEGFFLLTESGMRILTEDSHD